MRSFEGGVLSTEAGRAWLRAGITREAARQLALELAADADEARRDWLTELEDGLLRSLESARLRLSGQDREASEDVARLIDGLLRLERDPV